MEHTPTPYHVTPARSFSHTRIYGATHLLVCEMDDGVGQPEQANAEFIVRACNTHDEMVETLRDARRWFDNNDYRSWVEVIDELLAKAAKGE